jgi:hypothetical protein
MKSVLSDSEKVVAAAGELRRTYCFQQQTFMAAEENKQRMAERIAVNMLKAAGCLPHDFVEAEIIG